MIKSSLKCFLIFLLGTSVIENLYSQPPADSVNWKTNNVIALFPKNYSKNNGLTITGAINKYQNSNGFHLEIIGRGFATMTTPRSTFIIPDTFDLSNLNDTLDSWITSRVNGLSVSPFGLLSNSNFKGLSINGFGFYIPRLSGMGISIFEAQSIKAQGLIVSAGWTRVGLMQGVEIAGFNGCWILNGLQLGVTNSCKRGKGLQIGLFNSSDDFKGVQIGLLNRIGKLYIPVLNLNFKKKEDFS
ncbi:LA_2272 family surface repeat-containing protein [Owenweeksia hongkongensis]|uniref:LA_2272 family surface repeat-containing protein n=1 Tax=Owenweeksia hongkongensis TaxID=253245 RepID=UPI003A94A18A